MIKDIIGREGKTGKMAFVIIETLIKIRKMSWWLKRGLLPFIAKSPLLRGGIRWLSNYMGKC